MILALLPHSPVERTAMAQAIIAQCAKVDKAGREQRRGVDKDLKSLREALGFE